MWIRPTGRPNPGLWWVRNVRLPGSIILVHVRDPRTMLPGKEFTEVLYAHSNMVFRDASWNMLGGELEIAPCKPPPMER